MRSSTHTNGWRRVGTIAAAAGILGLGVLLGACSGSNGANGAAGATGATGATGPAGPAGPAAPGTTAAIGNAVSLTATITGVTFPAAPAAVQPVVKFKLVNESGVPVTGLTASSLGFAIAKLVPAGAQLAPVPPQTVAPQPQNSTQWQSYIYLTAKPAASLASPYVVTGTTPQPQATTERGTGTFVDNGDGTYVYTFTKDISTDAAVSYDPTLTHRVGIEIRGVAPTNSPVFTVQPSTGATTGITSREIVADSTCIACHTSLSAHGGARTAVQYCVLCHNPSSLDASTGESLDFKVMFHKIHMGANLPNVAAPATGSYFIVGYQNAVSDYSTINFPTGDLRTCYTCHDETNKATPDTVGWRQNPGTEACGSCHSTDNFTTGANHSPIALGGLKNTDCAGCHGNATTTAKATTLTYKGTLGVADAHVIPERDYQQKFAYQILSVTNSAPGQFPVVKFQITDPTNKSAAWNVLTDEPFTHCGAAENANANLSIAFAYSSKDYTNIGSGVASEIGQPFTIPVTCNATLPVSNGDGTFTATSTTAVPATAVGSAGVMLQGHPAHEFGNVAFFYNTGEAGTSEQEIPIPQPNAMFFAPITDAKAVARRSIADVAKCDGCHDQLNGHGNNRVGSVDMCATCHNANATDVVARGKKGINWTNPDPTDGRGEQTIDMKVMIHAIHAAPDIAGYAAFAGFTYTPYVVYHGSARNWMGMTPFPTPAGTGPGGGPTINHCTGCHEAGTYYPPDPTGPALPSATRTDASPTATTAGAAVCSSCHVTAAAKNHMTQNGASFTALKDPVTGNVVGGSQESCGVCHSAGAIEDVAVVHKLSSFP